MHSDNEENVVTLTPLNQFHQFCQSMYLIIYSYRQKSILFVVLI